MRIFLPCHRLSHCRSLVVLRLFLGFFVVTLNAASIARAEAVTSSCPAYEIEGSIEPAFEDPDSTSQAAVFVHTGGEPLVSHQVFATFTSDGDEPIGEPVVMVTDADGRATVPVPVGATGVSFVAEGPDNPACVVPDGAEPSVALEISSVLGATPENDDADEISAPVQDGGLAYTGPVTTGVVAAAVLVGAVGCGVWMGRGRKARIAG